MSPDDPPKKFCDSQIRKVVQTVLAFEPRDKRQWRECAADFVDDACARRYLESADWMVSRAILAINKTIRWRVDLGMGPSSACSGNCRWTSFCRSRCGDGEKAVRVSPLKDAGGRPVVVFSVQRWPKDDQDWLRMVIDALEAAATQLKGQRRRRRRRRQRQQRRQSDCQEEQGLSAHRSRSEGYVQDLRGEEEDTCTWLVDMRGAGPGDSPGFRTLRTLEDILTVHYPGRLKRVLIVNASAFLRMSIAVAERLVDEKARSKMVVLDTSSEKGALQLKSYIASADLQAILAHGQNRGGEDGQADPPVRNVEASKDEGVGAAAFYLSPAWCDSDCRSG